jgi:hypothetical protein
MINHEKLLSFVLIAISVTCTGCPEIYSLQANVPNVCKSFDNLKIDGAGRFSGIILREVSKTFIADLRDDLPEILVPTDGGASADYRIDIRLTSGEIEIASGISDFDFVEKLTIQMEPDPEHISEFHFDAEPAVSTLLPRQNIMDYEKPMDTFVSSPIHATLNGAFDVLPYVQYGPLRLTAIFTGWLPSEDFYINIKICFAVTLRSGR